LLQHGAVVSDESIYKPGSVPALARLR